MLSSCQKAELTKASGCLLGKVRALQLEHEAAHGYLQGYSQRTTDQLLAKVLALALQLEQQRSFDAQNDLQANFENLCARVQDLQLKHIQDESLDAVEQDALAEASDRSLGKVQSMLHNHQATLQKAEDWASQIHDLHLQHTLEGSLTAVEQDALAEASGRLLDRMSSLQLEHEMALREKHRTEELIWDTSVVTRQLQAVSESLCSMVQSLQVEQALEGPLTASEQDALAEASGCLLSKVIACRREHDVTMEDVRPTEELHRMSTAESRALRDASEMLLAKIQALQKEQCFDGPLNAVDQKEVLADALAHLVGCVKAWECEHERICSA